MEITVIFGYPNIKLSQHESEFHKWPLGSITTNTTSGGGGIPAELFQILKDEAMKVLHSICQQVWKTHQWSQEWKNQFSFQSQKADAKSVHTAA